MYHKLSISLSRSNDNTNWYTHTSAKNDSEDIVKRTNVRFVAIYFAVSAEDFIES